MQQVRAIRSDIAEHVTPMTPEQRRDLRDRTKRTKPTIETSVIAIDMSDKIAIAVGRSAADVKVLMAETDRWGTVEADLSSLLNGISSANLRRKYQLGLIADQVFAVTKQLIRSPENVHLLPIYNEMKRLRNIERPKKRKKEEEPPAAPPEGGAAD